MLYEAPSCSILTPCLPSMGWFLARHFRRGEVSQFLINHWQQLNRGVWIARINGVEQLGDVGHFGNSK